MTNIENKFNKEKTKIVIIGTGGTIAAQQTNIAEADYPPPSLEIKTLIGSLNKFGLLVDVECIQFSQRISHTFGLDDLVALGKFVQRFLENDNVAGLIITHGTNTLEETAYFLNLVLRTNRPIVVTGAMKPNNFLGSDGLRNLYNAINIIRSPAAANKGVLVTFNDRIIAARFVEKNNLTTVDGIGQREIGILGYIQGDRPYFYFGPTYRHTLKSTFNILDLNKLPYVAIFYAHIGAKKEIIQSIISAGAVGIISVGFGKGHQPPEVSQALKEVSKENIIIVRASRSWGNNLMLKEKTDEENNFITGNNLSPQKAMILLSLSLTRTKCPLKIQGMFDTH